MCVYRYPFISLSLSLSHTHTHTAMNVLVFDSGRMVKLADFGSAVHIDDIPSMGIAKLKGCSPHFAAPEVSGCYSQASMFLFCLVSRLSSCFEASTRLCFLFPCFPALFEARKQGNLNKAMFPALFEAREQGNLNKAMFPALSEASTRLCFLFPCFPALFEAREQGYVSRIDAL